LIIAIIDGFHYATFFDSPPLMLFFIDAAIAIDFQPAAHASYCCRYPATPPACAP